MRLSAAMPGVIEHTVCWLVDGRDVSDRCIEADDEAGTAVCVAIGAKDVDIAAGQFEHESGIICEVVRGRVEFIFRNEESRAWITERYGNE